MTVKKPLKEWLFLDVETPRILTQLVREFVAMQKKELLPEPATSFEEHFHLKEIEEDLLKNPQLARDKLLAKQVAQASLLGRQTAIIVNHALTSAEALKPENLEAMNLLMKIHAYANEMVDAKSAIIAKQRETQQTLKNQMIDFVKMNKSKN